MAAPRKTARKSAGKSTRKPAARPAPRKPTARPAKPAKPRKKVAPRQGETSAAAAAVAGTILAWEDDPFALTVPAPVDASPIRRPVPDLNAAALKARIVERAPAAREYSPGTAEFRYWTAADALSRGLQFWSGILPAGTTWFRTVGAVLRVGLDVGVDLNAYYDRRGLSFFHGSVGNRTVFSGESPEVVCHEMGHAILDALRPQLFDAASIEAAAFHESFGDMSALLVSLQLPSIRERTLVQTGGRIYRSSRLSRIAEQLGWAIRQIRPDSVDPDALRNAVNSFFYIKPSQLPPDGPASQLSSRPHSFSRVFTGAFFEALSGMLLIVRRQGPTEQDLLRVSRDAAQLLIDAVRRAPIVPAYFSQVAASMIDADRSRFNGRYRDALKSSFVRHGVLSLTSAAAAPSSPQMGVAFAAAAAADDASPELPMAEIQAARLGLDGQSLFVHAPSEPVYFQALAAAPDAGEVEPPSHEKEAEYFLEDLFRRGRVELASHGDEDKRTTHPFSKKTHELVRERAGLALRRVRFDCGFDCE